MKIKMKACLLALGLLLGVFCPLSALQIDSGKVRLVLHEGIGRFSLYSRSSSTSTDFTPLFVDQDPRTSGISLVIDDKIHRLGDSSDFSERVVRTTDPTTARFEWSSRSLEIVQQFTPVAANAQSDAEGVRMSIRITNRSRTRVSVGLRLCLDTYLGEDDLSHFSTDRHQEVRSELTVGDSEMIRYWLSRSESAPQPAGLRCITAGGDITSPDKIVFANWKRLSEASWDYATSSKRNFNLMPYSINDSAVCMYYEAEELSSGDRREIVLVLADSTLSAYGGAEQAQVPGSAETTGADEASVEMSDQSLQSLRDRMDSSGAASESVRRNLEELNILIRKIDELLASGSEISDEQLRLMEEILSAIKDKSERYTGGR